MAPQPRPAQHHHLRLFDARHGSAVLGRFEGTPTLRGAEIQDLHRDTQRFRVGPTATLETQEVFRDLGQAFEFRSASRLRGARVHRALSRKRLNASGASCTEMTTSVWGAELDLWWSRQQVRVRFIIKLRGYLELGGHHKRAAANIEPCAHMACSGDGTCIEDHL